MSNKTELPEPEKLVLAPALVCGCAADAGGGLQG